MPTRIKRQPNHASIVYCLRAGTHSYVGLTNNIHRRLRQHNGELKGGARYTRMHRPHGERWRLYFIVSGFERRRHAAQLEDTLHGNVTLPKSIVNPFGTGSAARRAWQLFWAFQAERFSKHAPHTASVAPLTVYWEEPDNVRVAREACPAPWPDNVRLVHARVPFALRPHDRALEA